MYDDTATVYHSVYARVVVSHLGARSSTNQAGQMLMFAHKLNIVASDIWLSPGIGIVMVRVAVARKE